MKKHVVKLEIIKKSLLAYLKEDMDLSSRKAHFLLKRGIQVNSKKAYGDTKLKDGDSLLIEEADTHQDNIIPQKMNFSILYEDDCILVVDKPPYMVVHPTKTHLDKTLANGIRYYFDEKNIKESVRFYNRIDMNTSGIVVIPKSSQAHSLLDRYSADSMKKRYTTVVSGILRDKKGRIELPISNQADSEGKRFISFDGNFAITEYEVLEEYGVASLLSVSIRTGRTHQIRLHLSNLGHPILGDSLYGGDDTIIKRQALHASEIEFNHPIDKSHVTIKSELPQDMISLIQALRNE